MNLYSTFYFAAGLAAVIGHSASAQFSFYEQRDIWGKTFTQSFDMSPNQFAAWDGQGVAFGGLLGALSEEAIVFQQSSVTTLSFGAESFGRTRLLPTGRAATGGSDILIIFPLAPIFNLGIHRLVMRGSLNGAFVSLTDSTDSQPWWIVSDPAGGPSAEFSFDQVLQRGIPVQELRVSFAMVANADADFRVIGRFIPPGSCLADLNNDNVVDDFDFSIFAAQYDVAVCDFSSPGPIPPCIADLNMDFLVDDSDFVIFAAAYNELVCS